MSNFDIIELLKQQVLENKKNAFSNRTKEPILSLNFSFCEVSDAHLQAAQALQQQLFSLLSEAIEEGNTSSDLAQEVVELHKRWLRFFLKPYTYEMHKELAKIYLADERITSYYDYEVQKGATQFLVEAINYYVDHTVDE